MPETPGPPEFTRTSAPVIGLSALPSEESSLSQADKVAAERLIRTTVQVLSGGAPVRNLDELIARNMGSLTHAEIAAGRLGTKVLGDIIGTVEQAKGNAAFNWNAASQQQIDEYMRQKGINPATFGHGMGVTRMADGGGAQSGGTNGKAESATAYNGNLGTVTSENYSDTPFAAAGLSFSTFSSLRSEGFGNSNIIHAAEDARQNGFSPNNKKIASAFAVLDRDDGQRRPERNRLLGELDEHLEHDERFQALKAQREQAKTDAERADIDKQLLQRGQEVSREVGYRQHIEAAPTARASEAGKLLEHEKIKQKAQEHISQLAPGDEAKATQMAGEIEHARRSGDAEIVQKKLDEYAAASGQDRQKRVAMAALRNDLAKDTKMKAGQKRLNTGKQVENTAHVEKQDDTLALLNDDSAPAKAEAPKPVQQATKTAKDERAKEKEAESPARPKTGKTAESKQAAVPRPAA
jgi:hypothetical protein